MRNRLVKIEISYSQLKNGISAQNMEDLFFELPKGTEIVNFAEDYCRCVKQITVRHEKFKEVEEGCEIPQIKATFTKDEDGVEDCELDFTGILEDGYKVDWDESGAEMVVVKDNLTFKLPDGLYFDEAYDHSDISTMTTFTIPEGGLYDVNHSTSEGSSLTVEMIEEAKKRIMESTGIPQQYIITTPTMGKSWIQEAWKDIEEGRSGGSYTQRGGAVKPFKLPEGYQVNCPVVASSDKKDSQENWGWWNDEDTDFPWEKKEKEEKCDHKWKKVEGINKYYVVCEICDKRNKEEEERINAK